MAPTPTPVRNDGRVGRTHGDALDDDDGDGGHPSSSSPRLSDAHASAFPRLPFCDPEQLAAAKKRADAAARQYRAQQDRSRTVLAERIRRSAEIAAMSAEDMNATSSAGESLSNGSEKDQNAGDGTNESPTNTKAARARTSSVAAADTSTPAPAAAQSSSSSSPPTASANADGFFAARALHTVRLVVERYARIHAEGGGVGASPDEIDSQCTVFDEVNAMLDQGRRAPVTWDLVVWDHIDRMRLWYRYRAPREGGDPFKHGVATDGATDWVAFGLRPRNWLAMRAHEYYPWLRYVTVAHLEAARASEPLHFDGVRAYDSTGLRCAVEHWCGIDDNDHLLEIHGSSDETAAQAFFVSLFWKYRMASRKNKPLPAGRELTQAWASFHARMRDAPGEIYTKLEEFYSNTMEGTLLRIHEVSRNHGLGCAVPRPAFTCPMCTFKTPKLSAFCRTARAHLVPPELQFYLAQLDELRAISESASKRARVSSEGE